MQTNSLAKTAAKDSPLWIAVPGHPLADIHPDTSGLPKVLKDDTANYTLWATLGGATLVGSLVAAATYIANKRAEKKWDEERKEIHENKVNAINPIEAPNYAPSIENVKKLRQIGLKDTLKLEDKSEMPKTAGMVVDTAWSTVLPLAASAAAAAGAYHLTKKELVDDRIEDLDKEILEARNKLDALYAKELELKGVKKSAGMSKDASWASTLNSWWGASLLAMLATTGYASYEYTKHTLAANRRKKLMQELIAKNTTNIPATLQVELPGKIPTKPEEQTYIQDLQERAENASKAGA